MKAKKAKQRTPKTLTGFNPKPFLIVMLCLLVAGLSLIGADAYLAKRLGPQTAAGSAPLSVAEDTGSAESGEGEDAAERSAEESAADWYHAGESMMAPAGAMGDALMEQMDPATGLERCYAVMDELAEAKDKGKEILPLGGASLSEKDRKALEDAVEDVKKGDLEIGFLMMDLGTGRGVAYNSAALFYSASSLKAPYVLSLAEKDPTTVTSRSQAMQLILVESDNASYEALAERYGFAALESWWKDAGVKTKMTKRIYQDYSCQDLARLWLRSYDFLLNDPNGKTLGEWLSDPIESTVCRVLDGKYPTHSKAGWNSGDLPSACDAAIVYAERPYLLVLMCNSQEDLTVLDPFVPLLDRIHDTL